jgi:hypothetical protein
MMLYYFCCVSSLDLDERRISGHSTPPIADGYHGPGMIHHI